MKFLIIFLLLTATPAPAALEGKFSGTGSAYFHSNGAKYRCSEIFLRFVQTPKKIDLLDGGYNCEALTAGFDPFTLELRGSKVFAEGKEVGTFENNVLDIFHVDVEGDFTYHWHLERVADGLAYLEEWMDGGKPALTVEGKLQFLP